MRGAGKARNLLLQHVSHASSTQELMLNALKACSEYEDHIIYTDDQTDGKTQTQNAKWVQYPKSIAASFGMRLDVGKQESWSMTPLLQMIPAIAYTKYCQEEGQIKPSDIKIKWPNDIYYKNKKAGGLLASVHSPAEGVSGHRVIFGSGVNISTGAPHEATSEWSFLPLKKSHDEILRAVYYRMLRLVKLYENKSPDDIFEEIGSEVDRKLLYVGYNVKVYRKGKADENAHLVTEGKLLGLNRHGGVDIKAGRNGVKEITETHSLRCKEKIRDE